MKRVEILATCRDESLLPYTTLVFQTIRTGFPTAEIRVTGNNVSDRAEDEIRLAMPDGCTFENKPTIIHHLWLEQLCSIDTEPFVALDTDVIFYESVENWTFDTALAGWRIPEWEDEFTNCTTRARLHTSLLFVDPVKVREAITEYQSQFPVTPFNPMANLFHPLCVPFKGGAYFYDTCSMLYHAIGGTAFSDKQLGAYFHFSFGTIPDVVLPHLSNGLEMARERDRILNNPSLGYGRWREAEEYFAARQVQRNATPLVVSPITPENAAKAREWNLELTRGDREAMEFNDLWYSYCHMIDDEIDECEDGRSKMTAEQKIEIRAIAAALYNCPFYIKHQSVLFPVVLQVTSMFADSVKFERSPLKHRRTIANVLSSCGDHMFSMVAMICGGWSHMRYMSSRLLERDYMSQHSLETGERI